MAAMTFFGTLFSIVISMTIPVGLPPAELDPALERMTPPQAILYCSSAGAAEPSADSANHAERLLAEPEVRQFLRHLDEQLEKLAEAAADGPRGSRGGTAAVLRLQPALLKILTSRPFLSYVSEAQLAPQRVQIRAALIADLGPLEQQVRQLMGPFKENSETVTIGGSEFQRREFDDFIEDVPLTFGIHDGRLIVACGDGEVQSILDRREGTPPKWLAELRQRCAVQRPATLAMVDIAAVRQQLARTLPPAAMEPLLRLGLRNMERTVSATGLDGEHFVRQLALDLDGPPQGLLTAFSGGALSADELRPIPADASVAVAVRFDVGKLADAIIESLRPLGDEPVDDGLAAVERVIGMKVREEFLASLGDAWTLHTSPSGGGLVSGWTLTAPVQNRGKLQLGLALERVRQVAEAQRRGRRGAKVDWLQFAGEDIYSLSLREFPFPGVSYCVTETHLVVAPFPQAVKSFLSHSDPKLDSHPLVKAQLGREPPLLLVGKTNQRRLLEDLYPWMQLGLFALQGELRRWEDVDIQFGRLPSLSCLTRHAGDGVMTMRRTEQGFHFRQRQQLPGTAGAPLLLLPTLVR